MNSCRQRLGVAEIALTSDFWKKAKVYNRSSSTSGITRAECPRSAWKPTCMPANRKGFYRSRSRHAPLRRQRHLNTGKLRSAKPETHPSKTKRASTLSALAPLPSPTPKLTACPSNRSRLSQRSALRRSRFCQLTTLAQPALSPLRRRRRLLPRSGPSSVHPCRKIRTKHRLPRFRQRIVLQKKAHAPFKIANPHLTRSRLEVKRRLFGKLLR